MSCGKGRSFGTPGGGSETRIGDNNLFMVGCHIGHDCRVGNGCTLVNGALVAGHVRLDDASEAALRTLRAQGLSDSEAVRVALQEGAARRLSRSALAEEAQRIADDEADRAEMRAIRDHLAELAPPAV